MGLEHLDPTMKSLIESGQFTAAAELEADQIDRISMRMGVAATGDVLPLQRQGNTNIDLSGYDEVDMREGKDLRDMCNNCQSIVDRAAETLMASVIAGELTSEKAAEMLQAKRTERSGCIDC